MLTKGLIRTTFEYKKFRNWFVIEIWGVNWTWYGLTAAHSEPVMLGLWKKWPHNSEPNFCSCWCVKYVWSVLVGRLAQTARHFTTEKKRSLGGQNPCACESWHVCVCMWCSEHALRDCAPESESLLGKMLRPAVPTCWSKSDELTFPWLIPERRCYVHTLQAQTTHLNEVDESLSLLLLIMTLVCSCLTHRHHLHLVGY